MIVLLVRPSAFWLLMSSCTKARVIHRHFAMNTLSNTFYSGQNFSRSDIYSLPLLASCLWRAVDLVSLVGFDYVFLLNQAAAPSLNHVGTYCHVSIQPHHPPSHVKGWGHVKRQAHAVWMCTGGVARHLWNIEGVEAGAETLGFHEGAGVRKWAGPSSCAVLLPTFTVRRERGKDVMSRGAAAAHLAHGRTDSRTLCLSRGSGLNHGAVVAWQRLRAHRTGAQFQHDERAAWGLSIVLQGEEEMCEKHCCHCQISLQSEFPM